MVVVGGTYLGATAGNVVPAAAKLGPITGSVVPGEIGYVARTGSVVPEFGLPGMTGGTTPTTTGLVPAGDVTGTPAPPDPDPVDAGSVLSMAGERILAGSRLAG